MKSLVDSPTLRSVLESALQPVGVHIGSVLPGTDGADFIVSLQTASGRKSLEIDTKSNGEPRFVKQALMTIKVRLGRLPGVIPVLAAPYLSPESRDLCRLAGANYLDLYGNILLQFDSVYIEKESTKTPEASRKRLRNLFSPRSSRVYRLMLEEPAKRWTLTQLAQLAGISLGQAHNTVRKLMDEAFTEKDGPGNIRLTRPRDLLDAWAQEYNYQRNAVLTFYSFVQDPYLLMEKIAKEAAGFNLKYAFSLHAGAWLVAPFVRFTDVHFYTSEETDKWVEVLDLRVTEAGGNVHIMTPFDEGVLNPIENHRGMSTVGKIQLYLDLINYKGRGKEQAEFLRGRLIDPELRQ